MKERERENARERESKIFGGDSELGEVVLRDVSPLLFQRLVNLVEMLPIMAVRRKVYVYNANVH